MLGMKLLMARKEIPTGQPPFWMVLNPGKSWDKQQPTSTGLANQLIGWLLKSHYLPGFSTIPTVVGLGIFGCHQQWLTEVRCFLKDSRRDCFIQSTIHFRDSPIPSQHPNRRPEKPITQGRVESQREGLHPFMIEAATKTKADTQ